MKYRFRVSKRRLPSHIASHTLRQIRLKGRNKPRSVRQRPERIRLSTLFEIAALPVAPRIKKKPIRLRPLLSRLFIRVCAVAKRAANAVAAFFGDLLGDLRRFGAYIRQRTSKPKKEKLFHPLPILSGFLCAAILVSLLSAGGLLLHLFAPYARSYVGIPIPNYVGQDADAILAENHSEHFNLVLQYEQNPDVKAGTVITQSPRAGVVRRIYERDGYCTVTLTVSRPPQFYTLENLVGQDSRDALLTLRNHHLSVSLHKIYSATVPEGQIFKTEPESGALLAEGDTVTLHVSLGAKKNVASVPNLIGMTETDALYHLRTAGFSIDTISYRASSGAAGTVLSQTPSAYTDAPRGERISFKQ